MLSGPLTLSLVFYIPYDLNEVSYITVKINNMVHCFFTKQKVQVESSTFYYNKINMIGCFGEKQNKLKMPFASGGRAGDCAREDYADKEVFSTYKLNSFKGSRINLNDCGISAIPNWKLKYSRSKTHRMKILLIGPDGSGKASLINTLFGCKVMDRQQRATEDNEQFFKRHHTVKEENGIRMDIVVDELTSSAASSLSLQHLQIVHERLMDEMHAYHQGLGDLYDFLLYVIPPSVQKMTHSDIELFKLVGGLTTVVPILSKADTYTKAELSDRKTTIRKQLHSNLLCPIPNLAIDHSDIATSFREIMEKMPFSIISFNALLSETGQRVRQYEWGRVSVDDPKHSDLFFLQKLMVERFFLLNKRSIHYYQYLEVWKDVFDGENCDFVDEKSSTYIAEIVDNVSTEDEPIKPIKALIEDEPIKHIKAVIEDEQIIQLEYTTEEKRNEQYLTDDTIIFTDPFKRLSLSQSRTLSSGDDGDCSSLTEDYEYEYKDVGVDVRDDVVHLLHKTEKITIDDDKNMEASLADVDRLKMFEKNLLAKREMESLLKESCKVFTASDVNDSSFSCSDTHNDSDNCSFGGIDSQDGKENSPNTLNSPSSPSSLYSQRKEEAERKRIQNEILKQREREASTTTAVIEDLRPPLPEPSSFAKLNVLERKNYFEKERMQAMNGRFISY